MTALWFDKAPASLEPWQAATLPVAGLTAGSALVESAAVRAGDTVVLILSTGGVAPFGPQIAKANGAEVIVCGQPDNGAWVRALGADHSVDAGADDWMEAVYRITGDRGADIVLEVIGGAHLGQSVDLAAGGGHVCQIGALDGFEFSSPKCP
ncbi:zinc-binding dehydrogenase [Aurantimonas endophytica]|uniref:NADPH:quinone reductase-like Zn-dependent oxidoreductase n=1 Tax=Aurantimonas endophytica TaxID=1522175 RepID=A0A7W6H9R1_9HYPH|nr:zinc-binding dehydrogenase [Aurantimonas endophytica]MBB4001206.1 NADPH:quinone reductase-like Zn-dependent oxidoreductase [Aurantimonas endophytica]